MPKRVCLQAGHKGTLTGATGAPGERDWTTKLVPLIASNLKSKGVEVYETDAKGNSDPKVTDTDWDLFLAVHYDADIYNDRGGFVDYPDQSVDASFARSKTLALTLGEHYFKTTGIPERPQRSNANTKFYYMWSSLTANTPCVIIECGVGNRKPEDYSILRHYELIAEAISDGILEGLGIPTGSELADLEKKYELLHEELIAMRESRDKWKKEFAQLEKKYAEELSNCKTHLESLQSTTSEQSLMITTLNETISNSTSENKRLLDDCSALRAELVDMTASTKKETDMLRSTVDRLYKEQENLQKTIKELEEKVKNKLSKFSKWELIKELFRRGR